MTPIKIRAFGSLTITGYYILEFQFWFYLKIASLLFLILMGSGFIYLLIRAKELLFWSRSLSNEMKWLKEKLKSEREEDRNAARVIDDACQRMKSGFSLDSAVFAELKDYIRSIALCYHPKSLNPELNVRVDTALDTLQRFAVRLENILNRPLLSRFRKVRLRHIKQSYAYSSAIIKSPVFHFFRILYKPFQYGFYILRFILLDPFSIIIYLSQKFGALLVTRYLFLEITLFIGKEAMRVYGDTMFQEDESPSSQASEAVFEALDEMDDFKVSIDDQRILDIRKQLFGLPKGLIFPPDFDALKSSVVQMTEITASRYFPNAAHPMEEVAIGPMFDRLHHFILAVVQLKEYAVIRRLYRFRIETILDLKQYASQMIHSKISGVARNVLSLYKWTRWPLKFYRLSKKSSAIPMAIDLSWGMTKRASVYFLYKYVFDSAYTEIVHVYRSSQFLETESGKPKEVAMTEVLSDE